MHISHQLVRDVHVVQIEGNEFEINALRQAATNAANNGVVGATVTDKGADKNVLIIAVKVVPPVPLEK